MSEHIKGLGKAEVFINGKKVGELKEGISYMDGIQTLGAPDIQKLDRPQPLGKKMDMDLYK